MNEVLSKIYAIGVMPVITSIDSIESADNLVRALTAGGIPQLEVTFRMEHAEKYIRHIRDNYPSVIVGAGTVKELDHAKAAVEAGSQFVVAPGVNPEIISYCVDQGVPVIPGIISATEIETASRLGLKVLKFFPAEQMGGMNTIKALSGPYDDIRFMPTGGVNLETMPAYLASDLIVAIGGTFMIKNYLKDHNWDEITSLCRKCVQTMLGLRLEHVGVNEVDDAGAKQTAATLAGLLALDIGKEGNSSVFVDRFIEVMKGNGAGTKGHLGFSALNLNRAVAFFERNGLEFNENSKKYAPDGKLTAVYFKEEIAGFAIHLMRR